MDYANGKIYRIVCEETDQQYIGSTCSTLVKRLSIHKSKMKSGTSKCACKDFINPKIFLIEDYPCDRKEQLLMRERYWMENTDCVNLKRPIVTHAEELIRCTKYYHSHKEQYQLYRDTNKEIISEKQKKKLTCECGSVVSLRNMGAHKKSAKHNKLMHN